MAEPRTLADISSTITAVLAATSGAALFLSVLHELAYYSIVGIQFLALLDTVDYIKQALYWLPAVLFLSAGNTLQYAIGVDYRFNITLESSDASLVHRIITEINFRRRIITWGLPAILLLVSLLAIAIFGMQLFGALVIPVSFVVALGILRAFDLRAWSMIGASVVIATGVFFLSIGSGVSDAYRGLETNVPDFDIRLSDPDVTQRIVVLRLFGRGALIRHPDSGIIEFVPSDRIKAISTIPE